MQPLNLTLDGKTVPLKPAVQTEASNEIWVPLHEFCHAVGALVKDLDGQGRIAVCDDTDGDNCVLLHPEETLKGDDGVVLGRLAAFAESLDLSWSVSDGVLEVAHDAGDVLTGLGVGDRPPQFSLPDIITGEPRSPSQYTGRKAVFYMWASW
ncbi:MAG: hypothetical protein VX733_03885 [Candidatus Latescibacterota bacterium]|nr:hypothetical protein [Candidatus Latescibacterota bacterium]